MPVSLGQMQSIASIGTKFAMIAKRVEAGATAVCQRYSQMGAGFAKENAPWHDQTGDARRGLHGYVVKAPSGITARISHGVLYGLPLEKKSSGRYAVLPKVLHRYQAEFYEDIKKVLKGGLL